MATREIVLSFGNEYSAGPNQLLLYLVVGYFDLFSVRIGSGSVSVWRAAT